MVVRQAVGDGRAAAIGRAHHLRMRPGPTVPQRRQLGQRHDHLLRQAGAARHEGRQPQLAHDQRQPRQHLVAVRGEGGEQPGHLWPVELDLRDEAFLGIDGAGLRHAADDLGAVDAGHVAGSAQHQRAADGLILPRRALQRGADRDGAADLAGGGRLDSGRQARAGVGHERILPKDDVLRRVEHRRQDVEGVGDEVGRLGQGPAHAATPTATSSSPAPRAAICCAARVVVMVPARSGRALRSVALRMLTIPGSNMAIRPSSLGGTGGM